MLRRHIKRRAHQSGGLGRDERSQQLAGLNFRETEIQNLHTFARRYVILDHHIQWLENRTTGEELDCEPIPEFLMQLIRDGGLVAHLEKRLRTTS